MSALLLIFLKKNSIFRLFTGFYDNFLFFVIFRVSVWFFRFTFLHSVTLKIYSYRGYPGTPSQYNAMTRGPILPILGFQHFTVPGSDALLGLKRAGDYENQIFLNFRDIAKIKMIFEILECNSVSLFAISWWSIFADACAGGFSEAHFTF